MQLVNPPSKTHSRVAINILFIMSLLAIAASVVLAPISRSIKLKNLQVALEVSLHQRLKRVAADRDETLANLIREAITAFVTQHEQAQANHGEEDN